MQTIAKVIGSGKEISWDEGRFFLEGQPVPLDRLLEYDGLGALEWTSEQVRQWAVSLAATELRLAGRPGATPEPQHAALAVSPAPSGLQGSGEPSVTDPALRAGRSAGGAIAVQRKPAKTWLIIAEALFELGAIAALAWYLPDIPAKWLVTGVGVAYLLLTALSFIPALNASRAGRIAFGIASGVLTVASLIVLLPAAIQVGIWAERDLPVREPGRLPAVERMIGVGRGDARRMLDHPRDWREAADADAFDFSLPDVSRVASAEVTGRVSLDASGGVETVTFHVPLPSGGYRGLDELLRDLLGYEGALTGSVSRSSSGLSGVCRLADASPTCSFEFVAPAAAAGSAGIVHLTFGRSFQGDAVADLSAEEVAFGAATDSHRGETMYALLAESVTTRQEAEARLADFQEPTAGRDLHWVVETSDHFTGMRPGWQVVMVAFSDEKTAKEYSATLRGSGLETYVKTVVKNCDDPIVVEAVDGQAR